MADPALPAWIVFQAAGVSPGVGRRGNVVDGRQFDGLTKKLAAGAGARRDVVKGLAGGLLAGALGLVGSRAALANHKSSHCAKAGQKAESGKSGKGCCAGLTEGGDGRCSGVGSPPQNTQGPCNAKKCPQGCCDGRTCVAGDSPAQCGTGGAACQACASDQLCVSGTCRTVPCTHCPAVEQCIDGGCVCAGFGGSAAPATCCSDGSAASAPPGPDNQKIFADGSCNSDIFCPDGWITCVGTSSNACCPPGTTCDPAGFCRQSSTCCPPGSSCDATGVCLPSP